MAIYHFLISGIILLLFGSNTINDYNSSRPKAGTN